MLQSIIVIIDIHTLYNTDGNRQARLRQYFYTEVLLWGTPISYPACICYSWCILGTSPTSNISATQKLQLISEIERLLDTMWSQILSGGDGVVLSSFCHLLQCYILSLVLIRGLNELQSALTHWLPALDDVAKEKHSERLVVFYESTARVSANLMALVWHQTLLSDYTRMILFENVTKIHFIDSLYKMLWIWTSYTRYIYAWLIYSVLLSVDYFLIYSVYLQVLCYIQSQLYQSLVPTLRSFLQKSIIDYPTSQKLLNFYLNLEQNSFVVTRVRQLFTSLLSTSHSKELELVCIAAVLFELDRKDNLDVSRKLISHI